MLFSALPERQGLYDPSNESDSCGVAMVTDIQGRRSHAIVADGLIALEHLEHRGAAGAEPNSGDGAGILLQLPVELLSEVVDFDLPPTAPDSANAFAAGICFLPQDPSARAAACEAHRGASPWRKVSTSSAGARCPSTPDGAEIGMTALGCMPHMAQLFLAAPEHSGTARRHRPRPAHVPSAQARRAKARCTSRRCPAAPWPTRACSRRCNCPQFFPDLRDERCMSAIAIVHSRFSTNTFPSWPLAHPFRFVAHNGEINTVRGNRNRMHAREAMLAERADPRGPVAAVADLYRRVLRLRVLRPGARTTAPRRPQPAPCRSHDDPRGVGEQRHHGPAPNARSGSSTRR